ncbi:MAG TPA: sensor histidine kinase [Thermoanaerobaculia bacterium]|jgi:signal transduction histidine kinase|nr:sensor histidine kinase [Thermoanaerobaculia bacterium]
MSIELEVEGYGARQVENHRARGKTAPSRSAGPPVISAQFALVQERERRRIARGLHDVVGHPLALARMQLAQLLATEPGAERRRALEQVAELLSRAVEETRSLTFELSSLVLCELGLEPALQDLGERVAALQGFRFAFTSDRLPKPLTEDAETILYRVVEELLVNAAKHSRAGAIELTVLRVEEFAHIAVEDDGVGFDVMAVGPQLAGLGLPGVRQLLHHLGGRLEIDSTPGVGSRISVIVPVRSDPS